MTQWTGVIEKKSQLNLQQFTFGMQTVNQTGAKKRGKVEVE